LPGSSRNFSLSVSCDDYNSLLQDDLCSENYVTLNEQRARIRDFHRCFSSSPGDGKDLREAKDKPS
jgi:hypothetical protein